MSKEIDRARYGYRWGPIFWRANVTVAASMFGDGGWELRWVGIAIPFTNWGIGFLWKRKVSAPEKPAVQP